MDEFSALMNDLKNNVTSNHEFFRKNIDKNPSIVYYKLNELSIFVGSRYNLVMEVHFPDSRKIVEINEYGTENISIIFDKFKKTFPISREQIKHKAFEIFTKSVEIVDAYMYEGKEGIKIIFRDRPEGPSRIELLPGSFHLWIRIDEKIEKFCNWLLSNVYGQRTKKTK